MRSPLLSGDVDFQWLTLGETGVVQSHRGGRIGSHLEMHGPCGQVQRCTNKLWYHRIENDDDLEIVEQLYDRIC